MSMIVLILFNFVAISTQVDIGQLLQQSQNSGSQQQQSTGAVIPPLGVAQATAAPVAQYTTPVAQYTTQAPVQYAPVVTTAASPLGGVLGNILGGLQQQQAASPSPSASASPSPSASNGFGGGSNGFGSGFGDSTGFQQPHVQVSEESKLIVKGIVEAFMHRAQLLQGEKECLENSVAGLTGDIVGTGKDVVTGIKAMMAPKQGSTQNAPSATAQGSMASAGIDGAVKLVSMVTLSTSLVKNCVQGDALRLLQETAHHFVNITYLQKRLVVSGVDVLRYLADSITAYEHRNYYKFGQDIGGALRKVLLSNSTTGRALPEGLPEETVIRRTIEGLTEGMFIPGMTLGVTDKRFSDVDLQIDLHRCITGNEPFFKEIFMALWDAMATFSMRNAPLPPTAANTTVGGQPQWTGEMMIAMMQLPAALQRCDISMGNQKVLMEAVQSLDQVRVSFHMPQGRAQLEAISTHMAAGVEAWTNWRFHHFGKEIGFMLREFLLMMNPRKYSIDANGKFGLRDQFDSSVFRKNGKGLSVFVICGVTFAVLVGFISIRAIRSFRATSNQDYDMHDDAAEEIE